MGGRERLLLTRRDFLGGLPGVAVSLTLVGLAARVEPARAWPQAESPAEASAGGPANPEWKIVMVPAEEPGEPLVISGTIYAADGRTPLARARLYVYHTDARGLYRPDRKPGQPRLRGWMKTNAQGQYEFRTIKPGSYPNSRNPAHIHGTVAAPGYAGQWIDDFHFDGDPFLSREEIARETAKGAFSGVLKLERDAGGVLRGRRDIRVGPR